MIAGRLMTNETVEPTEVLLAALMASVKRELACPARPPSRRWDRPCRCWVGERNEDDGRGLETLRLEDAVVGFAGGPG